MNRSLHDFANIGAGIDTKYLVMWQIVKDQVASLRVIGSQL